MPAERRGISLRWWCGVAVALLAAGCLGGPYAAGVAEVVVTGAGAACVWWALRTYRPRHPLAWQILLAAMVVFTLADVVVELRLILTTGTPSYPGPADIANLAGYLLCVFAGLALVRQRSRALEPTSLIDAGIVTGGVLTLAWVFVLVPDLESSQTTFLGKTTNVVFDLISMVLVAIIVRLALGPGIRNASWYWLAGAVGGAVLSDLLFAVSNQASPITTFGMLGNAFGAGACACVAAAALNPAMARLAEPSFEGVPPMSRTRLVTMTAAVLVAPIILLVRSDGSSFIFTVGAVVAWAAACVLVLLRLGGLVRARELMARVEIIVSQAGSALVAKTEPEEMVAATADALRELLRASGIAARGGVVLGDQHGVRARIFDAAGAGDPRRALEGGLEPVAAVAPGGLAGRGETPVPEWVPLDDDVVRDILTSGRTCELLDDPDLPPLLQAMWVAFFPMVSTRQAPGALVVCSEQPLRDPLRGGCESLAHLLSLALDSAAAKALHHQQAAERRFQKLFEHSADVVAVLGGDGRSRFLSPSADHLLGLAPGQRETLDLRSAVHPDDLAVYDLLVREATIDGGHPVEIRLRGRNRQWEWFDVVARDLRSVPDVASPVITARHITDRKLAEQNLTRSERRFRSLVHNSSDIIAIIDQLGTVTWVSDSVNGVLGLVADDIVGRHLLDVVDSASVPHLRQALRELQSGAVAECQVEVGLRDSLAELRAFELTLTDRRRDPAVQAMVCNARDITEQKAAEAGLRYQALHDHLTGLANRVLLRDRVEQALDRRSLERSTLGLLFIDLDDFKTVNDSLGHAIGDELLAKVATRIRGCCRAEDTAARLGGDEFAILVESAATEEEILAVAARLMASLQTPVVVGRRTLTVAASIGVASATRDDRTSPDELLRDADAAMYVAKGRGKNRIELFTPEMHLQAFDRLELKEDLVGAVARGEMRLHYQPIVDLSTGALAGYEALVRWQHPTRGLLGADMFVALAEETGAIVGLGRWVFESAVAEQARWRASGHDLRVAINMSPRQLESSTLVEDISDALARHHAEPDRITVELTESFEVTAATAARLDSLRTLGLRLAADDFGAGAASYAALQHLPFTTIKVDKSLIDGVDDPRGRAQVRSIIEMAHASGLWVVAEGVDAPGHAAALLELGCDYGQGFLFGRPAPTSELLHLDETMFDQAGHFVLG